MPSVVWFEGRFVAPGEARVALDDGGYLLGDGVFATLRGYAGACFCKEEHLRGLERGAELLGLGLPAGTTLDAIAALADEAARRTGERDAYVRITLARDDARGARLSILARPLDVPPESAYVTGVAAATVPTRRRPPLDPIVKTTSYALELVARREALAAGATEGVQLALDGKVAGGAMSNLFVVRGRRLVTPSLASGCRDGVTRRAVLRLAARAGLDAEEAPLDLEQLAGADEVFFTSSRVECLPVASLDGRSLATRFPKAVALRALLRAEAGA